MSFGSFFRESLSNAFRDVTHEMPQWGKEMVYRARLELWKVERRIMKNITSLFILLISFTALALSAIFFLIEYLNFTKTLAFLAIGLVLLIIGIILKI